MNAKCLRNVCFAIGIFAASVCAVGFAQNQPGAIAPAAKVAVPPVDLIPRVYPVADLVFTPPNYPFEGLNIGGPFEGAAGLGGGGFRGGGGGGFGGGGGGFNVPDPRVPGRQGSFSAVDQLMQAIQVSIRPQSWTGSATGGSGTIVELGGRLIISQTREIHDEIEHLLKALRKEGAARGTVTVRVWWLRLDAAKYQKLIAETPVVSPPAVNRKELETLAGERGADFGQVTCFDGQTVHVISGRFRNAVTSVIPVVGQLEPQTEIEVPKMELAAIDAPEIQQIIASGLRAHRSVLHNVALHGSALAAADAAATTEQPPQAGTVGYQPVISRQHAGALLELTPTRLPEEQSVILDLRSVVTHWNEQPEKPVEFRNVITLDRTTSVSQQLATTLKVPLRQPVIAGGLSLQPGDDSEGKAQLYLIVEAIDGSKTAK